MHHNFRLIPNQKKINPLFTKTKFICFFIYTHLKIHTTKFRKFSLFLDQYSGDIKLSQRRISFESKDRKKFTNSWGLANFPVGEFRSPRQTAKLFSIQWLGEGRRSKDRGR